MKALAASAICALFCPIASGAPASSDGSATRARPEYRGSKDPRGFEPALTLLFHTERDTYRRSNLSDAKLIFASLDKEKPFQMLGSDESYTAGEVMSRLEAAHAGKVRSAIIVAIERAGAEKALLAPLMKHAESFDVDVYRYGPVGKDYLAKIPIDLKGPRVNDPRSFVPSLTLMWPGIENGKRDRDSLEDALMIYSTVQLKHHILGIDREFTKEQIVHGLEKFYERWRPEGEKQPPPIVLGAENWGAGADLYETLQKLAKERGVDIYLNYVCNFAGYPTSTEGDKRLAELIE